jgi:hypothetical protein
MTDGRTAWLVRRAAAFVGASGDEPFHTYHE